MNPFQEIAFRVWYLTGWEDWYYEKWIATNGSPGLGEWFVLQEFRSWKANEFTLPPP